MKGANNSNHGIAGRTHRTKLGLPPIIGQVSGCGNGKANKLDTYSRDKFSGGLLSRICRGLSWTYMIISHGLCTVKNQLEIPIRKPRTSIGMFNGNAQVPKTAKTLNITRPQPRDLTAFVRGRSLNSRAFSSKSGSRSTLKKYSNNSALAKAERDDKGQNPSKQPAGSILEETIASSQSKGQKVRGLMRILSDQYFLMKCYEEIKSNPGNMTRGLTKTTLDDVDED